METPRLETDRLILREIQESDTLSIFHCWMKDENVSRYMWWKASADIADTERFVSEELGKIDSDSWYRWIIVEKVSNRIIGTSLLYFSEEGYWDISYNLGTEFWGKGYITEAMREVIKYATKDLGIKEIITSYAVENTASANVLRKLGFEITREIPYECSGGEIITTGKICRYTTR